ncbi:MAG: hypothetical protein IKA42_00565 [Clostridia bacterium]|nr:hypothetical protein [Clostridia bacterium]
MQKIFLCICFVLALFLHMPAQKASLDFDGEYTFYSTQMQTPSGCNILKNGNIYHITCKTKTAKKTKVKNVVGQSVKFAGDLNDFYQTCKCLGKIKSQYNAEGIVVAEGFSQKLGITKNLTTNFQVAFDGKFITVGTPVIMGSF